jgi:hypothetical protein
MSTHWEQPLRHYGIGILLLVGFSLLYWQTRVQVHTFDALSYTQDVESKPFLELYHPHHLLYGPVGRLAYELAQALGYDGRADAPIQALNALAGGLGVWVLWRIGRAWTGAALYSAGVASLIGVSYAYWLYASEVEVYTFAALFILLTLWAMGRTATDSMDGVPTNGILLGLTTAGAVMFHQTNAMLVLPMSLFIVWRAEGDLKARAKALAIYGVTVGLAVGLPYVLVGLASGFRTPQAYYNWLTDYAQTGVWGGNWNGAGVRALREGLADSISPAPLVALLFYAGSLVGFGLGWRSLDSAWRFFLAVWLLIYGGFFWWWEPWNIEFWIALLPLWAVGWLAGYPKAPNRWSRFAPMLPLCLAIVIFWGQYDDLRQLSDPANDDYQQMTRALQPYLLPTDVAITRGNILDLYLPFYAQHPPSHVLSLRGQPWEAIQAQLDHAYRRGQVIYLDSILLEQPADPQRNPFGLAPDQITQLRAYPLFESVRYQGQTVFYSIGQRSDPNAMAWRFDSHLHGWLEFGAVALRFEDGAWCFTGGGDPWIESPPLLLPAAYYPALEIEMSLDSAAEGGQVFWRREGEDLSEARSIQFPLQVGRHTYRLDLAGREGWADEIVFLRFDPIPGGTDATACIESLRFLSEAD